MVTKKAAAEHDEGVERFILLKPIVQKATNGRDKGENEKHQSEVGNQLLI